MQLSLAKKGSDSGLEDLINTVASEGLDSVRNNVVDFGLYTTMDMVKGAVVVDVDAKQTAIKKIANDSIIQDSMALYVAAEYTDMAPTLCKNAYAIREDDAEAIVEFTRTALEDMGNPNMEKKAIGGTLMAHYLNKELKSRDKEEEESQRGLQLGSSEDSEDLKKDDEPANMIDGVHIDTVDENAEDFLEDYSDVIDAALDVK